MRQPGEAAQRLRVRFGRSEEVSLISHLDLMRFWERALRRAGIPLAYSQGFSPHPRISMAAPLALGVTSEAELMDVYLSRWIAPQSFLPGLRRQMGPGIQVLEASAIPVNVPSLQSQVRFAEYRVVVDKAAVPADIGAEVGRFLEAKSLMWQHTRDTGVRSYDLRSLVKSLWVAGERNGEVSLGMVLRCDPGGAGRPEQVTAALGFAGPPRSIHRTKLVLETQMEPRR